MAYSDRTTATDLTRLRNQGSKQRRKDQRDLLDAAMVKAGGRASMSSADREAFVRRAAGPSNPAAPRLASSVTQRNAPTQSGGVANPPAIRFNDEARSPVNPARPTKLAGPNIPKGAGPAQINRALAENKAAVRPGGMGTHSYTQDAQRPKPMDPTNFNFRPKADKGVVTSIEPGDSPGRREHTDTAGNKRISVEIDPKYRTAGASATGTSVVKPGGPDQWRRDLHNEHPEIFKEGTVENKEFVEEFKRGGMDPTKAAGIASSQRADRVAAQTRQMPPSPAQVRSEIPPASSTSAAQVRSDIGATGPQAGQPPAVSTGKKIGQAARAAVGAAVGTPGRVLANPANPFNKAKKFVGETVQGFLEPPNPAERRRR